MCVIAPSASCKPSRSTPLGELQPIGHAAQVLDFITALPTSRNGYDALLTITDKFTKWITLIPGKARYWAVNYYD
jgi:hypothetical protein